MEIFDTYAYTVFRKRPPFVFFEYLRETVTYF